MWDEEAFKLIKKKGKGSLTDSMKQAVRMIPEKVKWGVIEKWLRYQQLAYMSKVMIFRKTLYLTGFRFPACKSQFYITLNSKKGKEIT